MNNELLLYSRGEMDIPRHDRAIARQGKDVYDSVRLAGMQADGSMALATNIMYQAVALDRTRRQLAGDDANLNGILARIELNALEHVAGIQRTLFGGF